MRSFTIVAAFMSSFALVSADPQAATASDCYYTVTAPTPPLVSTCTIFPGTTTVQTQIDCHGCNNVVVLDNLIGRPCPTIATPDVGTSTITATVCSPTPPALPPCNTANGVLPSFDLGPVCTKYKKTETKTSTIDCKSCTLPTGHAGPGPARYCTTTKTKHKCSTTTAYVCAPTPGGYGH